MTFVGSIQTEFKRYSRKRTSLHRKALFQKERIVSEIILQGGVIKQKMANKQHVFEEEIHLHMLFFHGHVSFTRPPTSYKWSIVEL